MLFCAVVRPKIKPINPGFCPHTNLGLTVYLSMCMSTGHNKESCKMAELKGMLFWVGTQGPRNHISCGGPIPTRRDNFLEEGCRTHASIIVATCCIASSLLLHCYEHYNVAWPASVCVGLKGKQVNRSRCLFLEGRQTHIGPSPRNQVLDGVHIGATW